MSNVFIDLINRIRSKISKKNRDSVESHRHYAPYSPSRDTIRGNQYSYSSRNNNYDNMNSNTFMNANTFVGIDNSSHHNTHIHSHHSSHDHSSHDYSSSSYDCGSSCDSSSSCSCD